MAEESPEQPAEVADPKAELGRLATPREDTEKVSFSEKKILVAPEKKPPEASEQAVARRPGPHPKNVVAFDQEAAPKPSRSVRLGRRDGIKLGLSLLALLITVPFLIYLFSHWQPESRPTPILGAQGGMGDMTVGGGTSTVFADASLEQAVRTQLALTPEAKLEPEALAALTTLDLSNLGVRQIRGIRLLTNLETLLLQGNPITSLRDLKSLPRLKAVDIRDTKILCSAQRLNIRRLEERGVSVTSDCGS